MSLLRAALGVMDFTFLGGSMGSVVGEKLSRLIEKATEKNLPLIIISTSGGARMYAHAFEKIDPTSDKPLDEFTIKLQPGGTVVANLVDSSGNKVEHAVFVSTLQISPTSPQWRGFADQALAGRAELRGLDNGQQYPVFFLDSKHQLGATAVLSLKDPSPTIELLPCGAAKARFVDPNGKPVGAGFQLGLHIVVTPGKPRYDFDAYSKGELLSDEDFASNVDQSGPRSGPSMQTDEKGELTFTALIPGATYRFLNFNEGRPTIAKEFVAESGKTFDMGDIVVNLP
jgi:hypothetical protein